MANNNRFGRNFGNAGISRGQFLRTAGIGAGMVAAAGAGFGSVARAAGPSGCNIDDSDPANFVVYGSGNAAADPICVQWAVDTVQEGGTVKLVGNFNFGDVALGNAATVLITRTITLRGEDPLSVPISASSPTGRSWPTKITGGLAPVKILGATISPTIEKIWLDQPSFWGVFINMCGGATINGNRISNAKAFKFNNQVWMAAGVCISELGAAQYGINGEIRINNNEIDLSPTAGGTLFGAFGITMNEVRGTANASFSRNYIANVPGESILIANTKDVTAHVSNNTLVQNKYPLATSTDWGYGTISVRYHNFGVFPHGPPGKVFVMGNIVEAFEPQQCCIYLEAVSDGVIVNNILKSATINGVVGSPAYGIRLTTRLQSGVYYPTKNCIFSGNDLSGLVATGAQVLISTVAGSPQYSPQNNRFGPNPDYGPGNTFGSLKLAYNTSGVLTTLGCYMDNGLNNICENNDFSSCRLYDQNGVLTNYITGGYVPGWLSPIKLGCIGLMASSSGAQVYEHPKLGTKYFPTGTSMCNQIANLGTGNNVFQYESFCQYPNNPNLAEIRARWAEHELWMQQQLGEPPPDVTWPEYQQ